jgi:hypothetical protein
MQYSLAKQFHFSLKILPAIMTGFSINLLCAAKLPFLFSVLAYLFSGNDDLREERRTKE